MKRISTATGSVVLVILLTSGAARPALAQGSVETDRDALVALYEATNGDNWTNNENWKTDAPLGQWWGVDTNVSGRVSGLNLVGNGLSGQIPAELGDLSSLTFLDLGVNSLSGPMPPGLGKLSGLEWLSVGGNRLSGPIPAELGNLSSLQMLYLPNNSLSGPIPPELGNLSALLRVEANSNDLSGPIPLELGRLVSLQALLIYDNNLSGAIPPGLGELVNLDALALGGNRLSGPIPSGLGNLTRLEILHLADNDLSGSIPVSLSNLASLAALYLSPGNDALCAPDDAGFAEWLQGIPELVWTGPTCSAAAPQPKPAAVVQGLVDEAVAAQGGLHAGGPELTIDVSRLFNYGSGSASARDSAAPAGVRFTATSEPATVAGVAVSGSDLTIAPAGAGEASIAVTGTDETGSAQVVFTVTVAPTPVPALPLVGSLALGTLMYGLGRRLAGRKRFCDGDARLPPA